MSALKRALRELLSLTLIAVVLSNLMSAWRSPSLDSERLPSFELTLIGGERVSADSLRGEPLVLYFWGTWCGVCSLQSPVIDQLSKTHKVLSVAVHSGDERRLRAYLAEEDYHFPVYRDERSEWSGRFKVPAFPTIFI